MGLSDASAKASTSQRAARRIEGPVVARAMAMRVGRGVVWGWRWSAWYSRNMLSTPTARTRKGMT